ncbi:MAG: adenylate/guanylate cyclase domain-containing protein [Spirochaetaceae bacterium]
MSELNEKLLDKKLESIESSRNWAPRIISKLEKFIRTANDYDLYKINPISFALEKQFEEKEVIDLFLWCTKEGIFTINWGIVCPTCGDDFGSFRTLKQVSNHYFCNVCRVKSSITLDNHIMVTFTINSDIRRIKYHNPDELSVKEFVNKYHYSREGKIQGDNITFPAFLKKYIKEWIELEPDMKRSYSFNFPEGYIVGFDLQNEAGFCIPIKKGCGNRTVKPLFKKDVYDYDMDVCVEPGDIELEVSNLCNIKTRGMIMFEPPMDESRTQPNLIFDPFLSGKILINNHTFNTLFKNEVIVSDEGIDIKDMTFLFTDLKGSTEIYERIGDMQAYSLVNQHFQLLEGVVTSMNGNVIKTIGDAIMSTFIEPGDALKAAIEMNKKIKSFNNNSDSQELVLKIGIHKGPSIVVSQNKQVDYFGRSVNIASRIQHIAKPTEINITEEVYNSVGINKLLEEYNVSPTNTLLKGIENELQVFSVSE